MRRLVAVAGEPAVLILKLNDLQRTAPAVECIGRCGIVVVGMDMVENIGPVAADDDAGMAAVGGVVGILPERICCRLTGSPIPHASNAFALATCVGPSSSTIHSPLAAS